MEPSHDKCTGSWATFGSTIVITIPATGLCSFWTLIGKFGAKSINKPTKPGVAEYSQYGTDSPYLTEGWYAVRCGVFTKVSCS
jgi:hypothetical protein